ARLARSELCVKVLKVFLVLVLLAAIAAAGVAAKLYSDVVAFRDASFGSADEKTVEIKPGASAHQVVRLLAERGVLSDGHTAWHYVRFLKKDVRPFKTGEYAFVGPMKPDDVFERIYRGEVKVYRFTVPEGLRMEEIAAIVGKSKLADEQA